MKFTIEITRRVGEGVEILHRSTVDVIGPKWARSAAKSLLKSWTRNGATGARVLNGADEEVYRWEE